MGICFLWIHVPLPLTSTILTESPSHRHSWTELFQMCYPRPSLFVCAYLSRYCKQNHRNSLPGPDNLAPDFLLISAVLDLRLSHMFQNVYLHIRPCQWGDWIWTYLPQM